VDEHSRAGAGSGPVHGESHGATLTVPAGRQPSRRGESAERAG
jgi:hypothetical protein